MSQILVLGFGAASTAYISLLERKNKKINVVGTPYDTKKIKQINKLKIKKNYLSGSKFSKNINFFSNLGQLSNNRFLFIIIGVNSNGINWATKQLNLLKFKAPILLLTKGLMKNKNKIQTISDHLKLETSFKNITCATGPCLATELAKKNHTRTLLACSNIKSAYFLKRFLENDYYHPEITSDIRGAEICAAIKNIYATIIGTAHSISDEKLIFSKQKNLYYNSSSALFEQSLREMSLIVKKLKGRSETVMGLAGSADLYVSVLGGRNSKMGYYLGQGLTYKKIISVYMKNITVEGAELIFELGYLLIKTVGFKKLPLAKLLLNTIVKNKKLTIDWKKIH